MRLHHLIRRARTVAVAAALVATSVSASGQTGQLRLSGALQSAAQSLSQPDSSGAVRRLSVDDAVKLALEQNLGIRIQRIDPAIQDTGIALARSSWMPNVSTSFLKNAQTQQSTSTLSGSSTSVLNGTFSNAVSMSETLPWGGNYVASWNNQRLTSTSLFQSYSPQLVSNLNLQYTQPLLRNFDTDQIRQQVALSRKVRDLSDINLQNVIVQTVRSVRNAYWDLVYAINNLKAQEQSLALSQQSLKDNQKRVEIGTLAPLDVLQSQAEVAANEQGVIIADAAIKQAQDNLRALILDPANADFWTVAFDPTDAASFADQAIDIDAAVRNALDKRADVRAAKNAIEQSTINIKFFKNQIKPDVNANVQYITTAAGGTLLSPVDFSQVALGLPVNRSIVAQQGYGSVLGDVLQNQYPNWTVGVTIGYPLGANTAHANLARVKLEYDQTEAQLKNLQLQIATQVRTVGRSVETNKKRVQSARVSRELQEKKLEAEEKKLAAGMSSTFLVIQAQRDLALARTLEIQAVSDYNKSLVDFEAIQQAPILGGQQVAIAR
jgi:outer membrane protein